MKNLLNKSLLLVGVITLASCTTQKKNVNNPNLLPQKEEILLQNIQVESATLQQFLPGQKDDLPYYEAKIIFSNIPSQVKLVSCFYDDYQGLVGENNMQGNKLTLSLRANKRIKLKNNASLFVTYKEATTEKIFKVNKVNQLSPVALP